MMTECKELSAPVAKPQAIDFTIGSCELGFLLVGSTLKGVCAILLGNDEQSLLRQLKSQFPQAAFRRNDKGASVWLRSIAQHIEKPTLALNVPLDMRGTPFQMQVWKVLQEIPVGQTDSYKAIAQKVAATAQEVGEACAANALAVVVPCHRVVRSDGGLAGFRWGVSRKRLLLQREQELAPDPTSLFGVTAGAVK